MFALLSAFGLEQFAKKFLVTAAIIAAFVTTFALFTTTVNLFLVNIDYLSVPQFLQNGFAILPSNTDSCISTIISTKIAAMLYDYQIKIISLRAG